MSGDKEQLFSDFPPVSTEAWEKKIKTDLKGADYDKKLVWRTLEGFNIRPYYRAEDLKPLGYLKVNPNEFPYVRGTKVKTNNWEITQEISAGDVKKANKNVLNALDKGATSLIFRLDEDVVTSINATKQLLHDIHIECLRIHFDAGKHVTSLLESLKSTAKEKGVDTKQLWGSVIYDPLGSLTITGNYLTSWEQDANRLYQLSTDENWQGLRTITISGIHISNAGASVTQELGLSLAMAVEYLGFLTDAGLSVDDITKKMQFHLGIGSNYFMEIAKLRAARLLWANIVEAYNPHTVDASKMFIHSTTTDWNKTIYDPHVNMLRVTTEAMSATIGGTDSLLIKPFDAYYRKPEKWTERIARNTHLILKEESYLNKVVDPAAGSYYVEKLTDSITEEAWKLFLEIQEAGGYINAFKNGIIQSKINETVSKRNNKVATGREVFVGTNQYPKTDEKILNSVDEKRAFHPVSAGQEKIAEPLKIYRGPQVFEELRLATEKSGKEPVVFLLTIGHPAWRKARAGFASGFFACGGYKIIDNIGFETIDDGIEAALNAGSDIIVLCSSDDEYPDIAPRAYELVQNKAIVVVAGAPPSMGELKSKGLQHFVHVKSNVLNTLRDYHQLLNIQVK